MTMSDYTVIPAAPGTVLIEASLELDSEATVDIEERPVIAWRVPSITGRPLKAVLFGRPDVSIPEEWMVNEDGFLILRGIRQADGSVSSGAPLMPRDDFLQRATDALTTRRALHLRQIGLTP